jgi:hypothetical protein
MMVQQGLPGVEIGAIVEQQSSYEISKLEREVFGERFDDPLCSCVTLGYISPSIPLLDRMLPEIKPSINLPLICVSIKNSNALQNRRRQACCFHHLRQLRPCCVMYLDSPSIS